MSWNVTTENSGVNLLLPIQIYLYSVKLFKLSHKSGYRGMMRQKGEFLLVDNTERMLIGLISQRILMYGHQRNGEKIENRYVNDDMCDMKGVYIDF